MARDGGVSMCAQSTWPLEDRADGAGTAGRDACIGEGSLGLQRAGGAESGARIVAPKHSTVWACMVKTATARFEVAKK